MTLQRAIRGAARRRFLMKGVLARSEQTGITCE